MMNKKKGIATFVKVSMWILVIAFFYWAITNQMFSHIYEEPARFIELLQQHLLIVLVSGLGAILIAVPLGILLTRPRWRKGQWLFVNIANLGQTIPSLAILALAMGFLGIGIKPAIIALFLFSVLPILQNTIAGLEAVDRQTIDAAKGMGYTSTQILWKIELPQATLFIFSGIRTALVINVGTAALAHLIGGGGLGVWVFTGIQLFDNAFLLSGAMPITILAIVLDLVGKGLEYWMVPKGLRLARKENV